MSCAFKSCVLEINSNGGFKQQHVESDSSTSKTIVSPLPQCLATKRVRVVTYHEGLPPIKSHDFLIMWSCEIKWQTKSMSTTRVSMATNFDGMVTYLEGLLPIKLRDPLVT